MDSQSLESAVFLAGRRRTTAWQKIVVGSISAVLLLAVVIGVVHTVSRSTKPVDRASSEEKIDIGSLSKSIESLCQFTDYKEACLRTLSSVSSDNKTADPKAAVTASIKVTLAEFNLAVTNSKNIGNGTTDKLNKEALGDCQELLEYAVGELQDALASSEKGDAENIRRRSNDLNNWLSAVLSYQVTCIDGLTHPKLRSDMTKGLSKAGELTENALAITSEISKFLDSMKEATNLKDNILGGVGGGGDQKGGRKLLGSASIGGRYPDWFSAADRKLLRASNAGKVSPNAVVAKDGSGDFKTIQSCIDSIPKDHPGRYVIHVKAGVYYENVIISKKTLNVFMYGDGARVTTVSGSLNKADGVTTFRTATFAVMGNGFICKSMGFSNTAGAIKHQAVALRVQSDMSAFFNCRMDAFQDTLYAQTHRQFYRNCVISGTIDFIFGMSTTVIQNCLIIVRKPMENQRNIVTANGRAYKHQKTGFVIHNCRIVPDRFLSPVRTQVKSYLGRPWKECSRTVFLESQIGDLIQPEGFLEWDGDFALKTLSYAEYNNRGPGADTSKRVKWPGYHVIKTRQEALQYTVGSFIDGGSWIKYTGIPFILGLKN